MPRRKGEIGLWWLSAGAVRNLFMGPGLLLLLHIFNSEDKSSKTQALEISVPKACNSVLGSTTSDFGVLKQGSKDLRYNPVSLSDLKFHSSP